MTVESALPAETESPASPRPSKKSTRGGVRGREGLAAWLFISPVLIIVGVFLVLPAILALWVSFSNWSGKGSPIGAGFVGFDNYNTLLAHKGLAQKDLGTSLRNNLYYVILVVPLQTALALGLALILNARRLKGKGFFRTAFYFPSVTSSVAIVTVFLFMFSGSGVINAVLKWFGINGPTWFSRPDGVLQLILSGLGIVDKNNPPAWLTAHHLLGVTWYDWLAGPSIAMCALIFLAVWTTGGTFMLMFLAALQDISDDMLEAASIDGATGWQAFRKVILPSLRPTLFLVITLGLIGTWQLFDAVYLAGQGAPSKTTLTPAFLSYSTSFNDGNWGQGAAISFILVAIIILMNLLQRLIMRERRTLPKRRRFTGPDAATAKSLPQPRVES
ncbi:multiple sugar transport system permease protein [Nakamurella panacisegetis]|uniref:Multiple sugar transport system permease protein n=1 Tax=Nakamurella panacisegetis TaxID=1090615 RepID=A0A1H0JNI1_9ACTN|nr:sugar ABC transporter permease [Nakamurella panacisegetis]SDO45080.1 multiple sugar transport system permease protein [Nakamurella panacisegetis]